VYALRGGGLETERATAVAAGYAHLMVLTASAALYTCACGDDGYGGRLRTAPPLDAFGELGRPGPPLLPLRVHSTAPRVAPRHT